eukprot:6430695-Amphidinium_carterae.1
MEIISAPASTRATNAGRGGPSASPQHERQQAHGVDSTPSNRRSSAVGKGTVEERRKAAAREVADLPDMVAHTTDCNERTAFPEHTAYPEQMAAGYMSRTMREAAEVLAAAAALVEEAPSELPQHADDAALHCNDHISSPHLDHTCHEPLPRASNLQGGELSSCSAFDALPGGGDSLCYTE